MFKGKRLTLIVPVYVDDLLPLGDKRLVDEFEQYIPDVFEVSAVGDTSFFLGIRIRRERESRRLKLDQFAFVQTILQRFGIKPPTTTIRTPLATTEDLVPNDDPVEDVIPAVRQLYQSKIGSLMYLMLGTRPDLAYSVGKLASFSSNPSPHHIRALDRVLHYLSCTPSHHLDWWPDEEEGIEPHGYTDADHAGDSSDRKSVGGYIFRVGGGTVFSWSSKKQTTTATSTTEAEYIALFNGSQQAAWIFQFYKQIGFPLDDPIEIYCDSQSALQVAKGEESHRKVKHIDVDYHSIRERVKLGQTKLIWVKSTNNPADILTKSIPADDFIRHLTEIGLDPEYDSDDEGEEEQVAQELDAPADDEPET